MLPITFSTTLSAPAALKPQFGRIYEATRNALDDTQQLYYTKPSIPGLAHPDPGLTSSKEVLVNRFVRLLEMFGAHVVYRLNDADTRNESVSLSIERMPEGREGKGQVYPTVNPIAQVNTSQPAALFTLLREVVAQAVLKIEGSDQKPLVETEHIIALQD